MAASKMSLRDRILQKANEGDINSGSGLRLQENGAFFKPKKGRNQLIIVPFVMSGPNMEDIPAGELWFRYQMLKHFNVGPEGEAVICPKTVGKRCPICEHRAALLAQGKTKTDQEVKDLAPKKREFYNVIDVDDNSRLKIWEVSYYNFGTHLQEEIREADTDLAADFADPDNGALLIVRMSEETMGLNKFLDTSRIDFKEREPLEKAVLSKAIAFDKCLHVLSYDELRKLFLDLDDEDVTDNAADEDESSTSKSARAPQQDSVPSAPRKKGPVEKETPIKPSVSSTEPEPEEDLPPKEETKLSTREETDFSCPHGGVFGTDCDSEKMRDHCETCDFWVECCDAKDDR